MSDTNGKHPKPPEERDMAVALIDESPHNVRKHFDAAELRDMAATVRARGILDRLTVWQPDKRRRRYQLIDGAKRLRSAKLAGVETVPVKIVDTDEAGARELMLIHTVQRSDPSAAELAEALAELADRHGYTAEQLAERIGQSAGTVKDLLKIGRQLPSAARDALAAGRIARSTAALIARVPSAAAREDVALRVLAGYDRVAAQPNAADVRRAEEAGRLPLTFAQTKELIGAKYMRELKRAPFNLADSELLPTAGSCEACPRRTGNAPDEYPDSRPDVCTDPQCYEAKVLAHGERLLLAHKEAGHTILPEGEAAKLFDRYSPGSLIPDARQKYVDLKEQCEDVPGGRSWKDLVGAQCAGEIIVALDGYRQPHELVPCESAMRVLRHDHGVKARRPRVSDSAAGDTAPRVSDSAAGDTAPRVNREEAQRRARLKAGKDAAQVACSLVADLTERMARQVIGVPHKNLEPLRALVAMLAEVCWSEACRQVLRRRKSEGESRRSAGDVDAIAALAAKMQSVPELLGLAVELVAARAGHGWGDEASGDGRAERFWKAWGINRKQLLAQAAAGKQKKREVADAKA